MAGASLVEPGAAIVEISARPRRGRLKLGAGMRKKPIGGNTMANWADMGALKRYEDFSLALLRIATGAFLVYGTQDNVLSTARMAEFVQFLTAHRFAMPELMAPLSVYAQFLGGFLLILGLLTPWTGLVIAFNFVVALWMVHWPEDYRAWWPAGVLVFLGLHFACRGGGRWSVDALLFGKDRGAALGQRGARA